MKTLNALCGFAFACLFVLLLASFFVSPALAQTVADATADTSVRVNYGSAVAEIATAALTGAGAAVLWAFRFLPSHVRWAMQLIQADQLLEKALAKARADVTNALDGKVWTIDVKNKVVAEALTYALKHFGRLVQSLGGADLVREKLQARLQEWIEKSVSR